MNLNTKSGDVFLFEFTSQMTLDEGCLSKQVMLAEITVSQHDFSYLSGTTVTNKNKLEGGLSASRSSFSHNVLCFFGWETVW
jgi:hypothetical protein